jgi:hypothetical protein
MEQSRIVFNRSKLKSRFQIVPYNSWGDDWSGKNVQNLDAFKNNRPQKEINYELNQRYEYEEWLFSDKPVIENASYYIERIDLLVRGDREDNSYNNNYINRVVNYCDELGIKVCVYKSREDMSYGRNAIKAPEYVDMGYHHSDKDRDGVNFAWTGFIALILYDRKYIDDYDLCKDAIEKFVSENGLPEVKVFSVHEKMRDLALNNKDSVASLICDVHNFFMDGKSGIIRDKIHLLTSEMKKYDCRSIDELVKCKVSGIRPMHLPKKDWSSIYQLGKYYKEYWGEDDSPVTYNPISNDNEFKSLRSFYYQTYGYSGQFDQDDFKAINSIDNEGKPISNFINYIFNKYTVKKGIEKIENTGYDNHDKIYNYKVIPIKNK